VGYIFFDASVLKKLQACVPIAQQAIKGSAAIQTALPEKTLTKKLF